MNETEAAFLSGRKAGDIENFEDKDWALVSQEFISKGVKWVVITLGSKGAYYGNVREGGLVKADKVKVVDTTAAGVRASLVIENFQDVHITDFST
jgi:ribokinase